MLHKNFQILFSFYISINKKDYQEKIKNSSEKVSIGAFEETLVRQSYVNEISMDGASPIFTTANNVTKVNNSIMQQRVWEVGALAKPSSMPEKL